MIASGDTERRRQAVLAFLACWGLFVAYSFLRVPIPGINEPHYLGMAKADWNPEWCRGDLFLGSSRPHRAFYLLIGWLTQFLSLEQTAIVGRIASLAMVAWGWEKFARALGLGVGGAVLSAASLLLVQSTGSWSGEWLIGGVESKVFSYGLVFAGWSALLQHRLPASGLWLGLATTLHPIVGMWATVATLCALAWKWWREAGQAADSTTPLPRLPVRISPALWWFCAAAPGIGWALPALRSADVATSQLADFIQVSYRLAHHLDPWTFPKSGHLFFGGLILFWLIAPLRLRSSDGFRFIDGVTAVAILFGVAATLLSYGPRPWTYPPSAIGALQLKMLKFYPFRLADLMAAVAVALVIARSWNAWNPRKAATAACGLVVLAAAVAIPGPDQTPGGLSGARRTDWIAALHWIKQNSPADALLLAANEDFGVKWWAERPEFVNYKDCPQDATGVVEWNNRLLTYTDWVRTSLDGDSTFSIADLSELHKRTGVTHLIVSRLGPIDAPAAYSNANFRVYQLDE